MENNVDAILVLAETLGECWLACISKVFKYGQLRADEDVKIQELLGLAVYISHPRDDDPVIATLGDRDVISRTLRKFSKDADMPDQPFTYSDCIYDHYGVDQYEWLVERLQAKKETKSATICLLTAGSQARHLPCLIALDAKIRDDRLELQFMFRSQNIFGRQYANLLALSRLQIDLAGRCKVAVGSLRGYIASAHIYAYDLEQAERFISGDFMPIQDGYYDKGPVSIRSKSKVN